MRAHLLMIIFISVAFLCCNKGKEKKENPSISVKTIEVSYDSVLLFDEFTGDIQAEKDIKIFSTIPDRILKMNVNIGDEVTEGDVLVVINHAKLKEAVDQAKSNLMNAKAQLNDAKNDLKRNKYLLKKGAVSQKESELVKLKYDTMKETVKQAEAALNMAQLQLDDAFLKAPFDGKIGFKFFNQGDQVAPGTPVLSVVQMDNVKIEIDVPESVLPHVKVGNKAFITVPAVSEKDIEAVIKRLSPVIDPSTRMAKSEIVMKNPEHKIKPGMFANVKILVDKRERALIIPTEALVEQTSLLEYSERLKTDKKYEKKYFVYLNIDNKAVKKEIEIGLQSGNKTEVLSGLKEGDEIVYIGQQNLKEGSKLSVKNDKEKVTEKE